MLLPRNGQRASMKLARQMWLLLMGPIALALGLYGLFAHESRDRILRSEASAELRNHATLVEAAVGSSVERGQVEILKQRIQRLTKAERILGIAAFDAQGGPILLTDHVAGAASELSVLARRALVRGTDFEQEGNIDGGPALIRTVTFSPKSGGAVIAVIVRDLRYLDVFTRSLDRGLILTGAMLLVLTALITAFVSRATVGRPAHAIVAGAERVAAGDLDTKVPEQGAEELSRLARAFNRMTASLSEAKARVGREEAARVAVERRLQHAQALAAVGQVAASIGHEIGSPLNVILGRAQRAAHHPDCPEPLRSELETIAVQSERISRVVARLLSVARPPQPMGRSSNLTHVIQETLGFLAPECQRCNIVTRFDPGVDPGADPAKVALDADRLFQVVFNLCLNAMQAQPDGGEIRVRVLSVSGSTSGSPKIAFEVEDRGPGVPPELREHIFDAFFTSKGDRGGSGLGLAIVSGIVREAGGSVELVPAERGGACFRVILPIEIPRPIRIRREGRA